MGRVWGQSPNSSRILGTVPKLSLISPDESQASSLRSQSELATLSPPGHHDLTAALTVGFAPGHKEAFLVVSR